MGFRTDRLSHPPTLSLKRGGESGCTKSVGCSRVHEHLGYDFLVFYAVSNCPIQYDRRVENNARILEL